MYNIRKRESQRLAAPEPSSPAALARAASRRFYNQNFVQKFFRKYHVFEKIQYFLFDLAALPTVTVFILLVELIVNLVIIYYVPYTEIDWKAYMQECEGFLNGTTNYALLKGDTGPLVYPAAFVYIYSALYFITSQGENIRLAQYIFALIYLLQMWLVLRLYTKSCKVPPYVLIFCSFTARRIHSIYVLRLFNDPIAILFLYAALNFFADYKFTWGSIFFSLGVACKMNILLFAPALFLFYLINLGVFRTIKQLAICGILQLLLGLPFLLTYPWQYIKGSFDLGRIFEHKWTVNYRFLPREYFEHAYFHLALLVVHLALLSVFAQPTIKYFKTFRILKYLQHQIMPQLEEEKKRIEENKTKEENKRKHKKGKKSDTSEEEQEDEKQVLSKEEREFLRVFEENLKKSTGRETPSKQLEQTEEEADDIYSVNYSQSIQLVLLPFFLCNFIGVVCARSLHYQFYVWYFHSLPYLAWSAHYGVIVRFALLGLIEFCWNIYPSTNFSSFVLHICHLVLLYSVGRNIFITINLSNAENK